MTNEEKDYDIGKALEFAISLINKGYPTLDRCVETAMKMAEWKEQQFIKWLTCDAKFYNKYGCEIDIDTDALIENFRQAVKEE